MLLPIQYLPRDRKIAILFFVNLCFGDLQIIHFYFAKQLYSMNLLFLTCIQKTHPLEDMFWKSSKTHFLNKGITKNSINEPWHNMSIKRSIHQSSTSPCTSYTTYNKFITNLINQNNCSLGNVTIREPLHLWIFLKKHHVPVPIQAILPNPLPWLDYSLVL